MKKRFITRFNSKMMKWMWGEECTCGENDGCYICSKEFRLYPYITAWVWGDTIPFVN